MSFLKFAQIQEASKKGEALEEKKRIPLSPFTLNFAKKDSLKIRSIIFLEYYKSYGG
jgi:hypothetical protein